LRIGTATNIDKWHLWQVIWFNFICFFPNVCQITYTFNVKFSYQTLTDLTVVCTTFARDIRPLRYSKIFCFHNNVESQLMPCMRICIIVGGLTCRVLFVYLTKRPIPLSHIVKLFHCYKYAMNGLCKKNKTVITQ